MSKPILKWVGGKTQLLPEIVKILPDDFNDYYEPFMGGAALFFHLSETRLMRRAHLSDFNPELVNLYKMVGEDPEGVMAAIGQYADRGLTLDAYLDVRKMSREDLTPIEQAARTIYLNKAGFNGLYRLNKSGGFNVPWGKRTKVSFYDSENLRVCSHYLKSADIRKGDFEDMAMRAQKGDLVYLDPPYVPASATSNFTGYTEKGFDLSDQKRVAACAKALKERGVFVVISNADTPLVREIYKGLTVHAVTARRSINADGSKRGGVGEVLACNF